MTRWIRRIAAAILNVNRTAVLTLFVVSACVLPFLFLNRLPRPTAMAVVVVIARVLWSGWCGLLLAVLIAHELEDRYRISARRWRNKGLCGDCGYEMKGLPENAERCPECGAALGKVKMDGRDEDRC